MLKFVLYYFLRAVITNWKPRKARQIAKFSVWPRRIFYNSHMIIELGHFALLLAQLRLYCKLLVLLLGHA